MNFKLLKRLLKYAKGYRILLAISLICSIIYVSSILLAPKIVGDAIDYFVDKGSFDLEKCIPTIILLLVIVVVGALFGFIMNSLLNKITYSMVYELRKDAFKKVLKVPVKYLDEKIEGDILQRIINDTDQVSDGLLQGFTQSLTGIITIIVTLIMMLIIKWQIGLIVIVLTPISLFVAKFVAKVSYSTFKAQAEIKGEMGGFLDEMLTNQKMVISYKMEERSINKYTEMDKRLYKAGVNAQFCSSLTNPSTRFVNALVYAIVATFGAILIVKEPLTSFGIGGLTAFLAYASQYMKPFNELSSVHTELSNSFASLNRVFELIDEAELIESNNELPKLEGNIKLDDISFSYTDKPLLKDISINIKKGEHVAIVGPTGCGKTTLINLLMRFYDVKGGHIYIDGLDIKDYSRDSLRKNIGMVLQDTWIFNGTVYDNIAFAKENASRTEVIEAAKAAYADDFIMHLKDGYDTYLTDSSSISEGEKQLICIARLMLNKPEILILDEATSNIDTRMELNIQKAFTNLMEGHTSFIIAHRLSTIRNADMILVMKDGNIVESGKHEELLSKKGFYYELYNSQYEER